MRNSKMVLAGAALAVAASFQTAGAQASPATRSTSTSVGLFDITPYAGYMVFGDFASGPLGTSVANQPGMVYGAQVGMKIAPNVSMIGNLARASSDISAGVPFFGGFTIAHSTILMYDAGLQLDIPVTSAYGYTFAPFVQGGLGAMRYDITESFVSTRATNFAANVGLGADLALGSGVGLRLMAKDYIGKFDLQQATAISFVDAQTTNNVALSAGLRFSF